MIPAMKILVHNLNDAELRDHALSCLDEVKHNNQKALVNFILHTIKYEEDCIKYANLIFLLDKDMVTPQLSLLILFKLVNSKLNLTYNFQQQYLQQDQTISQYLSNDQQTQQLNILYNIAKVQPKLTFMFLLYFYPTEVKTMFNLNINIDLQIDQLFNADLMQFEQISDKLINDYNEYFTQNKINACQIFANYAPFNQNNTPNIQVLNPILIHYTALCVSLETVDVIFPILMQLSPYQQTQDQILQMLIFIVHCLKLLKEKFTTNAETSDLIAVDEQQQTKIGTINIKPLQNYLKQYNNQIIYFLNYLNYQYNNVNNTCLKIVATQLILIICNFSSKYEIQHIFVSLCGVCLKLQNELCNNTTSFTNQIEKEISMHLKSPLIQNLQELNISFNVNGDQIQLQPLKINHVNHLFILQQCQNTDELVMLYWEMVFISKTNQPNNDENLLMYTNYQQLYANFELANNTQNYSQDNENKQFIPFFSENIFIQGFSTNSAKILTNNVINLYYYIIQPNKTINAQYTEQINKVLIRIMLSISTTHFSSVLNSQLSSNMTNSKLKQNNLKLISDLIASFATQKNNLMNHKNVNDFIQQVIQIVNDVLFKDFKYIQLPTIGDSITSYKKHDILFYSKDQYTKQQLESDLLQVILNLLKYGYVCKNTLIQNQCQDIQFYSYLNMFIESFLGNLGQQNTQNIQNINELINITHVVNYQTQQQQESQFTIQLCYLCAYNAKERYPNITANDTNVQVQIAFDYQYKSLCLLEYLGRHLPAQQRIQLFNKLNYSFEQIFSQILILFCCKNKYDITQLIQLIHQITQDVNELELCNFLQIENNVIKKHQAPFVKQTVQEISLAHFIRQILQNSVEQLLQYNTQQQAKTLYLKQFADLFPGQVWRSFNMNTEIDINQAQHKLLFQNRQISVEESEDDQKNQSVNLNTSSVNVMNQSPVTEITTGEDQFFIVLYILLQNLLYLLSVSQNFNIYKYLSESKYQQFQNDKYYKTSIFRFTFMTIVKKVSEMRFTYQQLIQLSPISNDDQQSINFMKQLLTIIFNDTNLLDDNKFFIHSISSINMQVIIILMNQIKLQDNGMKIYNNMIVHALSQISINDIVKTLVFEQIQQTKMDQGSYYIPTQQVNKYLFEIICIHVVEFSKQSLYKSLISLISSLLKQLKYISLFSQIDSNQLNTMIQLVLQQIFLQGGFQQIENFGNNSNFIITDKQSRTFNQLAQASNFNDLYKYFEGNKVKYTVQQYKFNTQYSKILVFYGLEQISQPSFLVEGQIAPIVKLHIQILDAFIDLLNYNKTPYEVQKLILLKSISLVQLYNSNTDVTQFAKYQLFPRITLILVKLFENQTTFQNYIEIVNIVASYILKFNEIEVENLTELFNNFVIIALQIMLHLPISVYVLNNNKIENQLKYINGALFKTQIFCQFGNQVNINDYIIPFLVTNQLKTAQYLINVDYFIDRILTNNIEKEFSLGIKNINIVDYLVQKLYYPDHITHFILKLLQQDVKYNKYICNFLLQMYQHQQVRKFILESKVDNERLINATIDYLQQNRQYIQQQELILRNSFQLLNLNIEVTYQQLNKNFAKQYLVSNDIMYRIITNTTFLNQNDEYVKYTQKYINLLYNNLQTSIWQFLNEEQTNNNQLKIEINVILQQLYIVFDDISKIPYQLNALKSIIFESDVELIYFNKLFTLILFIVIKLLLKDQKCTQFVTLFEFMIVLCKNCKQQCQSADIGFLKQQMNVIVQKQSNTYSTIDLIHQLCNKLQQNKILSGQNMFKYLQSLKQTLIHNDNEMEFLLNIVMTFNDDRTKESITLLNNCNQEDMYRKYFNYCCIKQLCLINTDLELNNTIIQYTIEQIPKEQWDQMQNNLLQLISNQLSFIELNSEQQMKLTQILFQLIQINYKNETKCNVLAKLLLLMICKYPDNLKKLYCQNIIVLAFCQLFDSKIIQKIIIQLLNENTNVQELQINDLIIKIFIQENDQQIVNQLLKMEKFADFSFRLVSLKILVLCCLHQILQSEILLDKLINYQTSNSDEKKEILILISKIISNIQE